jgi:DNA-binding beta-propeller fold protein YncE
MMLREKTIRLFYSKAGPLTGLNCYQNKLYALSGVENAIHVYTKENDGYVLAETIKLQIKNASGLAAADNLLYVADSREKLVYTVNLATKEISTFIDLTQLADGSVSYVVSAKGSSIKDLEINGGELWLTCAAGYSSCILRLELASLKVIKSIPARGPEPVSISYDAAAKSMLVLDASNREISEFNTEGRWTGDALKVSIKNPSCFSIDIHNHIVISGK